MNRKMRVQPVVLFCLLLTAYCLLVFSSSCKQKTDYTQEIARLDSASVVLINAEHLLLSVDTVALSASYRFTSEKLHSIMEKLSEDTVHKNTALLLSDAYQQSGNILNLLDNKKYLERAASESQQRISDLKHDLSENLIEKNKSTEYIMNEINASEKICHTVNSAITKAKSSVSKLDSLKMQIISLADSLNRK